VNQELHGCSMLQVEAKGIEEEEEEKEEEESYAFLARF
jgi:hypothetical protein